MFSIGGASYKKDWDKELSSNPTQLGINAAKQFNVGMEIDYESSSPNLTGLQSFVTAYRSVVPYDATGANYAARLTIDLGDGDTYLNAWFHQLQMHPPVPRGLIGLHCPVPRHCLTLLTWSTRVCPG
jgi:hypothetical protein